jgi:hypothetical protein
MPFIFEKNMGSVAAIVDPVLEGSFSLAQIASNPGGDNEITFNQTTAIITKLGLSTSGNFQFLHTIGNEIYVYVFGDRMGQVILSGISFENKCAGAESHGIDSVFQWYKYNRIAVKKDPVEVTIGVATKFRGFITGFTSDVQDAENRTIPFQMTIATLPENV